MTEGGSMYGLIGSMKAIPGKRDELITILADSTRDMPGCLSYILARDAANADLIWISEVWDSKASHDASLDLPSVRAAIAKGRPLIAGFGNQTETVPVAGVGPARRNGS
ncbi:MAG: antibiotic biosynthesis monooxygenase [Pseudomonadota bacterium]|nr:antibiotic biosynthesis monooxygenase [Pseudomonadota bacterium]